MSISRAWYVRCDECGNPAEISTESARAARSLALRDRFYATGGDPRTFIRVRREGRLVDLCPPCAGAEWDISTGKVSYRTA